MRVSLATQILNKSEADGLSFYSKHKIPEMQNCDATINFSLVFNVMFDALNAKIPCQGVHLNSKNYEILQRSLKWLDSWESNVISENISERKINQDALERFFGTVRMASGANDHPSTPTFLQVYKLLTVYVILKPPKYGNCTVEKTDISNNLIKISDIQNIYTSSETSSLEKLQKKLDGFVNQGEWEFSDIVEHDYSIAPIIDCLKYYVAGYLSHQITKRSSCIKCKSAFTVISNFKPETDLTNIKSRGWLKHPNPYLYSLISAIEDEFMKHVNSNTVFYDIIDGLITQYGSFTFPCTEHKYYVISFTIKYYINMRLRQYTRQSNQEKVKENAKKKNIQILYHLVFRSFKL
ncbi:unnamed protein product [Macrosiphum euphorbiae]|uniref:Transposable element P transposase n=1 Tax=Macrosiphum euphorbiae TaxID=13131 RepID=A0AAV0Y0N6_9HEMI|nr:unnamed protein product [Macrosiphum euphorbiae]